MRRGVKWCGAVGLVQTATFQEGLVQKHSALELAFARKRFRLSRTSFRALLMYSFIVLGTKASFYLIVIFDFDFEPGPYY